MRGILDIKSMGLVVCFAFLACVMSSFAKDLKVRGDNVVLRAAPLESSEVVTQVSDGDDLVTEKGLESEWVEIVPPSRVSFWVYNELVKDGAVAASKIQVRAGPGITYRAVGELLKDDKVLSRGEYKDWLKIAPPPGCKLWVPRASVEPAEKATPPVKIIPVEKKSPPPEPAVVPAKMPEKVAEPVKKPAPKTDLKLDLTLEPKPDLNPEARPEHVSKKPTSAPPPVPAEPVKPVVKKEPGAAPMIDVSTMNEPAVSPESSIKDKLVSSKDQGVVVEYEGVLRSAGLFVWRQPSRYRLVIHDRHGVAVTVCYVMGEERQLLPLKDKSLVLHGREYWIQGVRQPVVIPDKMVKK